MMLAGISWEITLHCIVTCILLQLQVSMKLKSPIQIQNGVTSFTWAVFDKMGGLDHIYLLFWYIFVNT